MLALISYGANNNLNVGTRHISIWHFQMNVTVRFMGGYSSITGERKAVFTLPKGITVRQLLDILSKKYGHSFENRVWMSEGKLAPGFKLFLGEEEVSSSRLDTKVNGDVTLFFLVGMAGGH